MHLLNFSFIVSVYDWCLLIPAPVITNTRRRHLYACTKRRGKASIPSMSSKTHLKHGFVDNHCVVGWGNKTKLFFCFCVNRSRNDYKVSLLQRKKQCMVQSLQRRSHWDRVSTQTMWLKLQLVDGLGIHLDVLLFLVEKIIEAMLQ